MREKVVVFFGFISVDAGFGPYLVRTAQRGLLDVAKDLLFVANTRGCGTELLRHAHLHRTRYRAAVPLKGSWAEC
jgi:hypothetical protein